MTQKSLGRTWAPSMAGSAQIRSVPTMSWVKVRRRSRFEVDADMPDDKRKAYAKEMFERFVLWMKSEDGAEWDGSHPTIEGPVPHFEAQAPDIQTGEGGATRPVARNLEGDMTGSGKEDYYIIASFWAREQITEVRTSTAEELFATNRPGVRPFRERT